MFIEQLSDMFVVFMLASARMLAMFMVLPFLSRQSLGNNTVRNGVVASFSLMTYPLVEYGLDQHSIAGLQMALLIFKEIAIGFLLGFVMVIPFWAIEAVGFFIDNQRGATLASTLNPLSGSEASPLGILLMQAFVACFFISGTFLLMLYTLYKSYIAWPIFEFMPSMVPGSPIFFISQLDMLMRWVLLLGGPVVIVMFLAELGLGLVSRFAPQLNVFILSMPIKSAVGIAFLIVYLGFVLRYFNELVSDVEFFMKPVMNIISQNAGGGHG